MFKWKKIISGTLCLAMLATSPGYAATSDDNANKDTITISKVKKGNAYIPQGTVLEIEISRTFSSKNFKEGDTVPLRLADNLIVNDVVVAPKFSRVKGIVTKARRAGGFGRSGKLEFTIVSVRTLNGVDIPLQYSGQEKGKSDGGAVAVGVLVSVIGGAFMKGQNVTIQQGTRFEAEVSADTDLEVSLDNLKAVMEKDGPRGVNVTISK